MGNKLNRRMTNGLLMVLDLVLINVAVVLAYWIRFGFTTPEHRNLEPYLSLLPWLSLTAIIIFYMFDLYTNFRSKNYHNLIYSVVLSVALLMLFTMALSFLDRGFAFPRSVIFISAIIQLMFMVATRTMLWHLFKKKYGHRRVLIVGNEVEDGLNVGEKLLNHSSGWFVLKGFLHIQQKHELKDRLKDIDVVLLCSSLNKQEKAEIMSVCTRYDKEVLLVPELFELFVLNSEPQQIDDMLVLSITPPKLSPAQALIKRTFDIVVSATLLVFVSPIMLALAILIPLTSPGSALYKQERLGKDGKPYKIYKFRSMVNDAEKLTGPVLATEDDPRITPIGRFIRATRLDELPQLFNVLKGDMSLVGPRPEREYFIEQFKQAIPDYAYRLSVKPGITGLAQVMAKYSTTVEDKLRYDLMYVRNYSFALDMKILFQTIRVVFQREQAAGVREDSEEKERLMRLFGLSETKQVSARQASK